MLDVVQNQEQLFGREEILEAFCQGSPALLTNAEGAGDGGWNQGGVRQWREWNKEDTIRKIVQQLRSGLEGETGLAGATRTRERQQLDIIMAQECDDLADLPLAAEEGGWLTGQIVRPVVQIGERREDSRQLRV